ncbi:hypothetical protein PO124_29070 [Bacillus licheniformis]|nr:hypothetical protein [Bacillus licheniformis]
MKNGRCMCWAACCFLRAVQQPNQVKGRRFKEINIGVQQSLSPLLLAKEKAGLKRVRKEGIKVKWTEFQSGPPQFEGLAADKLDFPKSEIHR